MTAKQTSHYAFPLDNMDVPVWGDTGEFVDTFTGCGPMDLQLIEQSRGADPENFPQIMRGEIAATIVLQALAQLTVRFPKNARADSIAIACHAFQPETKPIVPFGRIVFQEHGNPAVGCSEHIERSVIVVVAHGQTRAAKVFSNAVPPSELTFFSLPSGP